MISMKEIDLCGLDQSVYYDKLDNGLEVYLVPFKNKKNYIMTYVTKFGSIYTTFVPYNGKEYITVPDGIAHFLEHKMFEQEDGIDPFTFASKSGTYSNASTDFNSTRYYFEGNKNFKENLNYLLDLVGSPYFTDKNVEKEKGIIAEEIKQYDDEIYWFMEKEIYKSLFHKDNHRIDVAGTVDTINKITKEDLYNTYYTYYQPSNMFLVVAGDFDKDEAIDIVKNNKTLNGAKTNIEINNEKINEPISVVDKYKELTFNINNTKIGYSFKIPIDNQDILLLKLYTSMMLSVKFGSSSLFRERMKDKNLYTKFNYGREVIDNYLIISFRFDSDKKDEVIEEIDKELADLVIDDTDIERSKKVWIASLVFGSDDVEYVSSSIIHDEIAYGKVNYDKLKIFRSLNRKEYLKFMEKLNFENKSVVVVKPNKKV